MNELYERLKNDRLSDNTHSNICAQCKECVYWGKNAPYDNKYDKAYCEMFPYPQARKPLEIVNNETSCIYRRT